MASRKLLKLYGGGLYLAVPPTNANILAQEEALLHGSNKGGSFRDEWFHEENPSQVLGHVRSDCAAWPVDRRMLDRARDQFEKVKARVRAKATRPFNIIKSRFAMKKPCCRDLAFNTVQLMNAVPPGESADCHEVFSRFCSYGTREMVTKRQKVFSRVAEGQEMEALGKVVAKFCSPVIFSFQRCRQDLFMSGAFLLIVLLSSLRLLPW